MTQRTLCMAGPRFTRGHRASSLEADLKAWMAGLGPVMVKTGGGRDI